MSTNLVYKQKTLKWYDFNKMMGIKPYGSLILGAAKIEDVKKCFHAIQSRAFQQLQTRYTQARDVEQNVNSFFRAFGFAYLNARKQKKFELAFPRFSVVNFAKIKLDKSMENKYRTLLTHDFIQLFKQVWEKKMVRQFERQDSYSKTLQALINNNEVVDIIIVAYFKLILSEYCERNLKLQSALNQDSKQYAAIKESVCEFDVRPPITILPIMAQAAECKIVVTRVLGMELKTMTFKALSNTTQNTQVHLLEYNGHFMVLGGPKLGRKQIEQAEQADFLGIAETKGPRKNSNFNSALSQQKQVVIAQKNRGLIKPEETKMEVQHTSPKLANNISSLPASIRSQNSHSGIQIQKPQDLKSCERCVALLAVQLKTCFKCRVQANNLRVDQVQSTSAIRFQSNNRLEGPTNMKRHVSDFRSNLVNS